MALLKYEALMPETMYFVPINRGGWQSFYFKLNGIAPLRESGGKLYLMVDTPIKIDITDRKNPVSTNIVPLEEILIEVLKNGAYDDDGDCWYECGKRRSLDKIFKNL